MSIIFAMVSLETPPMILDMTLVVARRPCWLNDDVTYASRPHCVLFSMLAVNSTRYKLYRS